ncbi:MAG: proline/glycine betaine ABC transporter permease [Spirochaetaceae bacterium]|nr:MAG: proline/glycine betaine ABC transporter permease [Spirochaetaceae bacterium]
MLDFPQALRIPLASWVDAGMRWVLRNLGPLFDTIGHVVLQMLLVVEQVLLFIPWFVFIPAVAALAWKALRSVRSSVVFALLLFAIGTFGYWQLAMNTLAIVVSAVLISLIIGIPVGILMAWSDRMQTVMKPVLDAMQTLPSFVYLIPALMLFGLGKVPATFATIIYAVPPVIRLTNVGIREVPRDVIEAARAYGANRRGILLDVQLPLARPSILVGINQTTMMALAMVVIGSMIGARTLGMEVLLAINRVNIGQGVEAGVSIVIMAIVIDRITYAFAHTRRRSPGESTGT